VAATVHWRLAGGWRLETGDWRLVTEWEWNASGTRGGNFSDTTHVVAGRSVADSPSLSPVLSAAVTVVDTRLQPVLGAGVRLAKSQSYAPPNSAVAPPQRRLVPPMLPWHHGTLGGPAPAAAIPPCQGTVPQPRATRQLRRASPPRAAVGRYWVLGTVLLFAIAIAICCRVTSPLSQDRSAQN
jgi:hypothetical protein